MDEEIIQRIVYIVLAIVFFFAFSKKKKTAQKQDPLPKKTQNDEQWQQTKNTKTPKQESDFPSVKSISTKNTTFTTMKSEVENLETIEDEVESSHRIINKKIMLNKQIEQNKKTFKISSDDLRKAVILSEIIRPKYF
ncbi:MAG: hypothetical protein ACUVQP_09170 [Bacteroidales bacterium]